MRPIKFYFTTWYGTTGMVRNMKIIIIGKYYWRRSDVISLGDSDAGLISESTLTLIDRKMPLNFHLQHSITM